MEQVFKIFEELMGTTKKSEKATILIRNQGNRLFTSTLKWLLDPFVLTGISSKKLSKNVSYNTTPIQTWEDMMAYFENHHTGSDDDTVLSFLSVSKSLSNKDAANIIKEMIRDINIPRGTSNSYLLYLKLAALSKAVMVLEETDRAKRKE